MAAESSGRRNVEQNRDQMDRDDEFPSRNRFIGDR